MQLTLAEAWLCSTNSAHPQTDPCEPSRRLGTLIPEPGDLNAASHTLLRVTEAQRPVSIEKALSGTCAGGLCVSKIFV